MDAQLIDLVEPTAPPGYMSETEVHTIIQNYNNSIGHLANQIEELNRSNSNLLTRNSNEMIRNRDLEKELNQTQLELEKAYNKLENQRTRIQALENSVEPTVEPYNQEIVSIQQEIMNAAMSSDPETFQKILSTKLQQILEIQSKSTANCVRLIEENSALRSKLEAFNQQDDTEAICKNCKKTFLLNSNKEGSCTYHPGRMKYYSCKGCGDDVYYTCCNRCTNCTKGCRTGKHVAA